jgi:hypothetical protein
VGFTMAEPSLMPVRIGEYRSHRRKLEKLRYESVLAAETRTKEGSTRQQNQEAALDYNAISAAHGVLCDLFNRFPLQMYPCIDGGIELPPYERAGMLPVLYFLLRRDYRDQHHLIKICKVCGCAFKAERGDSEFCSRKCYKRYNDRDRYLRQKTLRKDR